MSDPQTATTSESSGDWGTAAIWSTGTVPNAVTADVTIDSDVSIASAETFTAGALDVAAPGSLAIAGSLDVTGADGVDGGVSLDAGSFDAAGGLTLATLSSSLGGSGAVSGAIDNAGLIYAASGLLDIAGPVSGTGALEIDLATGRSATLELAGASAENVAFVGLQPASTADGVLRLDQPGSYSGTISGFTFGEAIDLPGQSPASLTAAFSGNSALGTITVAGSGGTIASLTLAGNYTHIGTTLVSDGNGGTELELVPPASEIAVLAGDWSDAAIWNDQVVPDSAVTGVTIGVVTIAPGESFLVGGVSVTGSSTLEVEGSLTVAGGLTADSAGTLLLGSQFGSGSGFVAAGNITVESSGRIEGAGELASSGTLTNDGTILFGTSGGTLTLAAAAYQQSASGEIYAGGQFGTVDLAPTDGPGGFLNLVNGTLSLGTYVAENGSTLSLPGPVTDLTDAVITLDGSAAIEAGGSPILTTLTQIGSAGSLALEFGSFTSPNAITIDGGTLALLEATLDAAGVVLVPGPSEIVGDGAVSADISNGGTILAEVGAALGSTPVLDLAGSVSGDGMLEIGDGATLELGQASPEAVTFDAVAYLNPGEAPQVLRLDAPGGFTGVISGFTAEPGLADAIDLPGFAPGTMSDVYTGTTAGGVLEILAPGSIVAGLSLSGDYAGDSFTLVADGHGGAQIELILPGVVPCFTRGTRIATPSGDVAVEALRVGDRVMTAGGEARPVVWIGERRVDCAHHPRPELVRPVRVRAGAFGSAPRRDLLLSPDHAVFAEGVLIPVKYLVNGASIAPEPAAEAHYFHVELDRHDVLLAEGLPAESYLDTGNRAQFLAGIVSVALQADGFARSWADACAPLVIEGESVLAVRRRLLCRLGGLGWARSATPQFAVYAGEAAIPPASVNGKLYQWLLPPGTREARIRSSTAVPAGLGLGEGDCRTLGVRVGAVFVDTEFVPLDDTALAAGFHPMEGSGVVRWRWTDGDGVLALPPGKGPRALELLVRDVMAGWEPPAAVSALAA